MTQLKKTLGLIDGISLLIGITIGSAIFATPQIIATYQNSFASILMLWIIVTIFVFIGSLIYAELGSRFPNTGGEFIYISKAFGPFWGFIFGWAQLLIIRTSPAAGISLITANYVGYFFDINQFQKNILGAKKNPSFWASGISVVMHMKNPMIPAMHFNTRYICTTQDWFGGGMDVTPSIKDDKEKKEFHKTLKKMCDQHNKKYYTKYKKWCDEYFYLPHRKEPRGIGGIFFDYKKDNFEKDFKFVRDVGITFQFIFEKIIRKKMKKKWTKKHKELQFIKRGRYTEFNLLYDRGTKFGLQTGGNVEGILMSLPPLAKWK